MRVLIDGQVFTKTIWQSNLIRLFDMALEGRHRVFPDPLDAPEFEYWLGERDTGVSDEVLFAMESSFDLESRRPALREVRVTTTSRPRWTKPAELPLEEALQILGQPLSVVVENQRNDRDFLLAVADTHQRKALRNALEGGWLRFDHGGGLSEMIESLEEAKSSPGHRMRSFWVFDSDSLAPGRPSPDSRSLRRLCRKWVDFHCLERRSAENYLPLPAIREIWARERDQRERAKAARAFGRLDDGQRHHFNMKGGFRGDEKRLDVFERKSKYTAKIAAETRTLFADVDAETTASLATGFSPRITAVFSSHRLYREDAWFEQDGLRSEMRPVIDELIDLC